MQELKVAVIGTGHLGTIHTRLWKENSDTKLSGIYDVNQDKAKEVAERFDCKHFETLESALENSDAVTIAVPTSEHYKTAKICIEHGNHCLIEKPITSTYSEALELIQLAKDNNVLIQVGHVERFNPAIAALSGFSLEPIFIEAHRLSQFKPRAIDVSVVHDLMIHDIDIILWMINSKIKKIDANGVAVLTDTTDICNARLTFENGAVANITASRISANPMRKMRVFQKDAYISIDFGKPDVEIFRLGDDSQNLEFGETPTTLLGSLDAGIKNKNIFYQKPNIPTHNAISEEQISFVTAIRSNSPAAVSMEDAAEALRIAEEISKMIG